MYDKKALLNPSWGQSRFQQVSFSCPGRQTARGLEPCFSPQIDQGLKHLDSKEAESFSGGLPPFFLDEKMCQG